MADESPSHVDFRRRAVSTGAIQPRIQKGYKCRRCGQLKKGHVCPFAKKKATTKDASCQAELDSHMTVAMYQSARKQAILEMQSSMNFRLQCMRQSSAQAGGPRHRLILSHTAGQVGTSMEQRMMLQMKMKQMQMQMQRQMQRQMQAQFFAAASLLAQNHGMASSSSTHSAGSAGSRRSFGSASGGSAGSSRSIDAPTLKNLAFPSFTPDQLAAAMASLGGGPVPSKQVLPLAQSHPPRRPLLVPQISGNAQADPSSGRGPLLAQNRRSSAASRRAAKNKAKELLKSRK